MGKPTKRSISGVVCICMMVAGVMIIGFTGWSLYTSRAAADSLQPELMHVQETGVESPYVDNEDSGEEDESLVEGGRGQSKATNSKYTYNQDNFAPTSKIALQIDRTHYPTTEASNAKIDALRNEYGNNDIIGYIDIPGTSISYPVLQTTDNKHYLDYNAYGDKDKAGAIYMDYENDGVNVDDMNTIIYGHNMKDNIMFHAIRFYRNKIYWDTRRTIILHTLSGEFEYEIFAFYSPTDDFPYLHPNYSESEFKKLIADIKDMEYYSTGIKVNSNDRLLQLSTCSIISDYSRFVVVGKLMSINGEKFAPSKQ